MRRYTALMACPKFGRCSANVCPLDPDWHLRTHGPGEPICSLALECVKTGSDERLQGVVPADVLEEVRRHLPGLASRTYVIRRALERAATSGSRLDNFKRLDREPPGRGV